MKTITTLFVTIVIIVKALSFGFDAKSEEVRTSAENRLAKIDQLTK